MIRHTKPPFAIRHLTSPWLTWKKPSGGKCLYLTFDDGPDPTITPVVLELLKEYGARATFFMTGSKAEQYPELVTLVREAGHRVGNHGFHHLNGWKTPASIYIKNVQSANKVIPEMLFRPPYGKISPAQVLGLRKLGFDLVMWTVMTHDYRNSLTPEAILNNSIKHMSDGAVVVLHDSRQASKNVMPVLRGLLSHFGKLGYGFCCF